jgi:anti-anti-sigma factor
MSLKIQVTPKQAGYYELALDGRLDTATHGQLDAALKQPAVKAASGIRLDLAKLTYMSSMGLRVVMRLMKELKERKAVFQAVNLQPQIKKVFDIAAALPVESVFASVKEADAYLDAMQKKALQDDPETRK